ncbi:MAG: aldehyde dehydrogenase family protein [Candidatus Heimdallarchaeota archaeon]
MLNEDIAKKYPFLVELGIEDLNSGGSIGFDNWTSKENRDVLEVYTPIDGSLIAKVVKINEEDYEMIVSAAEESFKSWRTLPAPKRGQIVREIGEEIRLLKEPLGKLITLEMGKILVEGLGEVQEAIDIADFAVGQSRMLYGLSMHSERPQHVMKEQWHPLGVIGIITAFNFPMAVWSWNAMIAAIAGDTMIWKPSSQTPLCAIALQKITNRVMDRHNMSGVFNLMVGNGAITGQKLIDDVRIPLISATGSTGVGRKVAEGTAKRLAKSILELGGNNAIIVMEDADLDLVVPAILFGSVGTSGQRCTTTRRIIVHKNLADKLKESLVNSYKQIKIGNPLEDGILMGPVVNENTLLDMENAMTKLKEQGGNILIGGERHLDKTGFYINPAIAEVPGNIEIVRHETFAPLLYIMTFENIEEAINLHNDVPQGLSSSMFTNSIRNAELFLSTSGSDCGIANINIGTSGAEIGGAFGGEKETGGGREAGSDSWKYYMRRQTNTINWSSELPLAQGIDFSVE